MKEMKSKYDEAVAKARGEETGLAKNGGAKQEIALPEMPDGALAMVAPFDASMFADELREKQWDCAPQIVTLQPGFVYHGILEGNGPDAELVDRLTGVVKELQTWILRDMHSGVRISFLSSAQLNRKLPGFVGSEVKIARGQDRNIDGGRRMTEYFVAGPKTKSGFRSWATPPALPAADETS